MTRKVMPIPVRHIRQDAYVPDEQRAQLLRDRILGWHRSPFKVAGVAFLAWLLVWDSGRTAFATIQGKHHWLD